MFSRSLITASIVCLYVCPAYAEPTAEDLKKASALFDEAEKKFKIGEYQLALADYKSIYLLTGEPALLFNIGQCHRFLGNDAEAIKSYKTFLRDANPEGNQRALVEKLIAEIESKAPGEQSASLEVRAIAGSEGATLFIDGAPAGQLPVSTSLTPGAHNIELRRDNVILYTEAIELKSGENRSLSISLTKNDAKVSPAPQEGVLLRFDTSFPSASYLVALQTSTERLTCPQPVEKDNPCELRVTSTGGAKLQLRGATKLEQNFIIPARDSLMNITAPKTPKVPLTIGGVGLGVFGIGAILRLTSPFDPDRPPAGDPLAFAPGERRFFLGGNLMSVGAISVIVGGVLTTVRLVSKKRYAEAPAPLVPLSRAE